MKTIKLNTTIPATRATRTRMKISRLLFVACLGLLWHQTQAAQFQEATTAAGLANELGYCISAAWGDYDQDGYLDLYIAIGATSTHVNALYHNNRNGTFTKMTGAQVGPIATDVHASFGCSWVDLNNDGYPDMLVVNGGWAAAKNDLYMNNGNGTFRRATGLGRLTDQAMVSSWAACADFDGDGLVDIYLAEGNSTSGPFARRLYHANPSGTFKTVDFGPNVSLANDGVWGDYNNDLKPDLYVCDWDSPSSGLWRNDGQTNFTKMDNGLPWFPPPSGWIGHAAWGDYDNDGFLDIAIFESDGTHIYRNDGNGNFAEAMNFGVAEIGTPAWADYDNDGHLDLLLVAGQGAPMRVYLYRNNGDGTFTAVSEPLTSLSDNWLGGAWGDYDNDGCMDIFLTQEFGHNRLYHNLGNTNHWIKFRLMGTVSNRDANGAKVRIKATIAGQSIWQMREINGGYAVQNDMRPNFGLGDATNVDLVRIEWPSGIVEELTNVPPAQIVTIVEPKLKGAIMGDGLFHLSLTMGTNRLYHLETSTDLAHWTALTNCTGSGSCTPVKFVDPESPSVNSAKFYRMR